MANFKGAESITMPVAAATVLAQYRFVGVDNQGRLGYPAANAAILGVTLSDSPASNDLAVPVAIRNGGVAKVECHEAITAGAHVNVEATTGKAGSGATDGSDAVGVALETGADGRVIQVALI